MADPTWTGLLNAPPPPDPFADIAGGMSQADLLAIRARAGDNPALQNLIAPYEHRAFAREWTAEDPWIAAPSLAVATPAYSLAKLLSAHGGRSEPSMAEITQGYQGIWEGLKQALTQGGA